METSFWSGFFKSINCEFKNVTTIQGDSGIQHSILALGIDEEMKRIVIVQDEQDARVVSMVQADVQAKIPDYSILMVRPISINLSTAFTSLALLFGSYKLTDLHLANFKTEGEPDEVVEKNKGKIEELVNLVNPQIEIIQRTKPNLVPIFKEIIQQLSHLKFISGMTSGQKFEMDFQELMNFNPVIYDTTLGICPLPLYNFSVAEAESFFKPNLELNQHILKKHGIYQFFYPPADSLALGIIENEKVSAQDVIKRIIEVPKYGHPLGKNELIEVKKLNEIVDALKDKNLIVEGEISLTLTEDGKEQRMLVKYAPRESIFKKISYIFSLKVDFNLKDLFK
jgi:hypothetical protein